MMMKVKPALFSVVLGSCTLPAKIGYLKFKKICGRAHQHSLQRYAYYGETQADTAQGMQKKTISCCVSWKLGVCLSWHYLYIVFLEKHICIKTLSSFSFTVMAYTPYPQTGVIHDLTFLRMNCTFPSITTDNPQHHQRPRTLWATVTLEQRPTAEFLEIYDHFRFILEHILTNVPLRNEVDFSVLQPNVLFDKLAERRSAAWSPQIH